jgi:3-dehydroquinate synthase
MNSKFLCPEALEIQSSLLYPDSGLIVCDARIKELYPDFFAANQAPTCLIAAGEDAKNLNTVQSLYQFFLRNSLGRSDMVHVFGGGTICDLAAYAVSTYKRGCRLQLYPSTLLAMVDAAIGGKTGINFHNLKNHIGSFYPAERVILHKAFLQTLAPDELRQGMAEMLKAHMLFEELPLPDFTGTEIPDEEDLLAHALYKMSVCQEDPFDKGPRMLLNFGHSFGHALESHSAYRIKHGDAVAAGMNMACDFSLQMNFIDRQQYNARKETLKLYPYPAELLDYMQSIGFEELYPYLIQDKKNGANLRLILPVGAEIKLVELNEV